MINLFVGIGRTTKDIDLRYSQNGTAVARFTLAINDRFNKDEANFVNCVAFKKAAELIAQYVKKGHQIGVEGRVQTGSYEKDGQRIYTTDIIVNNVQFLESRNSSEQKNPQQQRVDAYNNEVKQAQQGNPFQDEGTQIDINDSDLPF